MIINELQVGPICYTVKFKKKLLSEQKGVAVWGEIIYEKLQIKIEEKITDDHKIITLLHEALHAILWQLDYEHNEQMISSLAFSLFGLLRDNPDLVGYFQAELHVTEKKWTPVTAEKMGGFIKSAFTEGGFTPMPIKQENV